MRVTVLCPSSVEPVGGVIALYEFANGLARRGHRIQLVHLPIWNRQVDSLDDLDRHHFEPSITHHLPGAVESDLHDSDIVFGTGGDSARFGHRVLLVQGIDMLHPHLERHAMRTPCLKICVASWLVDVGRRFGVPPEQMQVVPMGIDHDLFRPAARAPGGPPRVAMLHHTHTAKGWEVGRRALDRIHDAVPSVRASIFGTTTPPEPWPDWFDVHLDPPPRVLVDEVYARAQVFIQPSSHEGFGFTAVEAMACGAALVTTDNGGADDYAFEGETARVVPPGDADGLADRAIELLTDEAQRSRLAEAGERHVRRFDWDLGAEILEGHLERYLADPAAFQRPPGPAPTPEVEGVRRRVEEQG